MSQEIINVLNYLGEQLGIAIDWSSENVWPQVMDILGRYRLLEIVSSCLWIVIQIAFIVYALVVLMKCFKASAKIKPPNKITFGGIVDIPVIGCLAQVRFWLLPQVSLELLPCVRFLWKSVICSNGLSFRKLNILKC